MKTSERRRKKKNKGSTSCSPSVVLAAPLVVFVFFFGIYVGSSGLFGHPAGQFTVGQHPLLQPQQQERQLMEEKRVGDDGKVRQAHAELSLPLFLRTAVPSGLMVREQPHGLTCGARLLYESFDEQIVRD